MTDAQNTIRQVMRHKKSGSLFVVLRVANSMQVEKAMQVPAPATLCSHTKLNAFILTPVGELERENDVDLNQPGCLENVELDCSDSVHLLADLGVAEKDCQSKESIWKSAKEDAAEAKKDFDKSTEHLRELVRRATGPSNTPLLDEAEANVVDEDASMTIEEAASAINEVSGLHDPSLGKAEAELDTLATGDSAFEQADAERDAV